MNFYSGANIDRAGPLRRDTAWVDERLSSARARVLPVWREKNFVTLGSEDGSAPQIASISIDMATALAEGPPSFLFLGEKDNTPYFTIDLSHLDEPAPTSTDNVFVGLRDVGGTMDRADGALLSYAKGLIHWHERHPFCARCGSPSEAKDAGHVRVCVNPDCNASHFPRTDPAVIMLVHRGDRCVLAHNRRNPLPMFSTLAGFVEPGESLEEAVAREVLEEVGIRVGSVRYHSSQPWPFPGNIMLGFHAEAESTEITVEEAELAEARWFERDDIINAAESDLKLSRPESISRRLIDDWVNQAV